jgi:hypothetical protein
VNQLLLNSITLLIIQQLLHHQHQHFCTSTSSTDSTSIAAAVTSGASAQLLQLPLLKFELLFQLYMLPSAIKIHAGLPSTITFLHQQMQHQLYLNQQKTSSPSCIL